MLHKCSVFQLRVLTCVKTSLYYMRFLIALRKRENSTVPKFDNLLTAELRRNYGG